MIHEKKKIYRLKRGTNTNLASKIPMTDLTDEASLSRVVETNVGIQVPFVDVHPDDIKTHN